MGNIFIFFPSAWKYYNAVSLWPVSFLHCCYYFNTFYHTLIAVWNTVSILNNFPSLYKFTNTVWPLTVHSMLYFKLPTLEDWKLPHKAFTVLSSVHFECEPSTGSPTVQIQHSMGHSLFCLNSREQAHLLNSPGTSTPALSTSGCWLVCGPTFSRADWGVLDRASTMRFMLKNILIPWLRTLAAQSRHTLVGSAASSLFPLNNSALASGALGESGPLGQDAFHIRTSLSQLGNNRKKKVINYLSSETGGSSIY